MKTIQTLSVLGRPVRFAMRVEACMPPHVPVPKPGPCPGAKRGVKKLTDTVKDAIKDTGKKTVEKKADKAGKTVKQTAEKTATARKKAAPKAKGAAGRAKGRHAGRDVREDIDYDKLESLFAPTHDSLDGEDLRLKEIARMQGFDARPPMASKADVDAMVRAGGLELFRGSRDGRDGTSGGEYARRFRDEDVRYGPGWYGNGIYATPSERQGNLYANGKPDGVLRMVADPDTRIIELSDLERQMRDDAPPELWHRREADQRKLLDMMRDASTEDEMNAVFEAFNREGSRGKAKNLLTTDSSLYAMAKGYDLVRVGFEESGEGDPYYVILNRSAVTVEDPSTLGGAGVNRTPAPSPASVPEPRKPAVAKKTAVARAPKPTPVPEPAAAPAPVKPAAKAAGRTAGKAYPPPPSPEAKAAREHADNLIKAGRVPSHVLADVREGLYAMADQSPQGMRALKGVGIGAGEPDEKIGPEAMFQYMPRTRTIAISPRFNTKAGRDAYERAIAKEMSVGYMTPTGLSPLAGSMVHEYGHHMAFRRYTPGQAGISRDVAVPVLAAIARQIGVAPPRTRPQGMVLYTQEINPWWTANSSKISRAIGGYAAKSIHEAIAEGWQEGSTRGTQARPWARDIVRVLNR